MPTEITLTQSSISVCGARQGAGVGGEKQFAPFTFHGGMMEGLDKIDLKILSVLQEDASHSATEIADSVGLSQSPCCRRIQRLKEEGYITRIVAMLDRRKFQLHTQLFVQVKVIRNDQQSLQEFTDYIRSLPEVLECHVILGAYDFLLRIIVKDMEAYEKFYFGKLSSVPNVREVNSFVAAWEVKSTTSLPLKI